MTVFETSSSIVFLETIRAPKYFSFISKSYTICSKRSARLIPEKRAHPDPPADLFESGIPCGRWNAQPDTPTKKNPASLSENPKEAQSSINQ